MGKKRLIILFNIILNLKFKMKYIMLNYKQNLIVIIFQKNMLMKICLFHSF